MMKKLLIVTSLAAAMIVPTGAVIAADIEPVYGSQLMTNQERLEYRKKITNAKTASEREKIRSEHHAMMKERAKEKNVTLPDEPPSGGGMGGGMHQGDGMGQGMGTGGGRGRDY